MEPFLFLVYVNDLPLYLKDATITMNEIYNNLRYIKM